MKVDKFIILIILFILILAFGSYWQFRNFRQSVSEIRFPEFKMPTPQSFSSVEVKNKEFVSPDGKFKLNYLSDWTDIGTETLKKINSGVVDKNAETLFFGSKFKFDKAAFASLLIQEMNLGEKIEEIIKEMKESSKKNGAEMTITKLEIVEKEAYFEAEYKKEDGTIFISKEKILFPQEKAYLVSVFAVDSFWPEFKAEADEILNSAQIIP